MCLTCTIGTHTHVQVQITVLGKYSQTSVFARGSRNELQYILMANTTYTVTVSHSSNASSYLNTALNLDGPFRNKL